ncbi:MAG: class E sortase [Mycobacteriales bacterium]
MTTGGDGASVPTPVSHPLAHPPKTPAGQQPQGPPTSWRGGRETLRTLARGLGQVLLSAGVVVLLFVVYELWITNFYTYSQQHTLAHQLQRQWRAPATASGPPFNGSGLAIIYIPRFGRNYHEVIVQGVSVQDLRKGPGHYPGTAMPGQVGNFVVSGHRTTYGAPFNRLNVLRNGDAIVIETRTYWYTYRVTGRQIVLPNDLSVIAPVPDHPGARASKAMITLTTCNPEYSATQRLIIFGTLASQQSRSAGAPPALAGL